MTWTAPVPDARGEGPNLGEMRPILQVYLDQMRLSLLNVCAGLTAEQLCRRPVPPSTLSLLGLVRHLTKVERTWFRIRVASENVPGLFPENDTDFDDLDDADEVRASQTLLDLQAEWVACDAAVAALAMETTFDHRGAELSLGLVYVHLVHEYARHLGHADLLRESIDGVTGR
jgi:hypothetical protein